MSVQPAMPFKYQGMDVEALGHLVSARVVEMLEPVIRRMIWDAVLEHVGKENARAQVAVNRAGGAGIKNIDIRFVELFFEHMCTTGENLKCTLKDLYSSYKKSFTDEDAERPIGIGDFTSIVNNSGFTIKVDNHVKMVYGLKL